MPHPIARPNGHIALRILASSDVHMNLTGWDQRFDIEYPDRGLARLASAVSQARAEGPAQTLLVDNGDFLQGTPVGDFLAEAASKAPHPLAQIMNAMGYDAIGLGNHDFDFGLDTLAQVLRACACPAIASNLLVDSTFPTHDHIVIERRVETDTGHLIPLRIGVFSVLPPQTMQWNARHLKQLAVISDPLDSARASIAHLQTTEHCDIILGLSHSGLSQVGAADVQENFTHEIAKLPGLTALIGGHSHKRFPHSDHADIADTDIVKGTAAGVPLVMPGYGGQSLGVIDLTLIHRRDGWTVSQHSSHLMPVTGQPEAEDITTLAAPALRRCARALNETVGTTASPIHSFFPALTPAPAQAALASALLQAGERFLAGTGQAPLPVLAAAAPNIAGGRQGPRHFVHIPTGPVTERHLGLLNPFANTLSLVRLSGAALWNWMEHSCRLFGPAPVEPHGFLQDPDMPIFNFDALFELEAEIDVTQAQRVTRLLYQGRDIEPEADFWVAMSSYRAAGGGGFPLPENPDHRIISDLSLTDCLKAWLTTAPLDSRTFPTPWRHRPSADLPVVIDTSPQADVYLNDIAAFHPSPLGRSPAGFLRLQVTLPSDLAALA